jgi:hypothetical protein
MNNLVTIRTFTYPSELLIIRTKLESEGIYYFVKNELITQVHPYLSTAVGGLELQVREEDVSRTLRIFKENNWIRDEDLQPSPFLVKLYHFFSRIPFLKSIYKTESKAI